MPRYIFCDIIGLIMVNKGATMHKFESPARVAELNPEATLRKIGLKNGDVFCDIGAGTGIFTVEAAKITDNTVYAIDTSDDMLRITEDKCKQLGLKNVKTVHPVGFSYPIDDGECDIVFMCTVFHEIDDTTALLKEISRIIDPHGKLIIIEFYEKETPMGPPITSRMSEAKVMQIVEDTGFVRTSQAGMGENFYICEFVKND